MKKGVGGASCWVEEERWGGLWVSFKAFWGRGAKAVRRKFGGPVGSTSGSRRGTRRCCRRPAAAAGAQPTQDDTTTTTTAQSRWEPAAARLGYGGRSSSANTLTAPRSCSSSRLCRPAGTRCLWRAAPQLRTCPIGPRSWRHSTLPCSARNGHRGPESTVPSQGGHGTPRWLCVVVLPRKSHDMQLSPPIGCGAVNYISGTTLIQPSVSLTRLLPSSAFSPTALLAAAWLVRTRISLHHLSASGQWASSHRPCPPPQSAIPSPTLCPPSLLAGTFLFPPPPRLSSHLPPTSCFAAAFFDLWQQDRIAGHRKAARTSSADDP